MKEAIEKRISRRTYLKEALTKQEIHIIKNYINTINQLSGLTISFLEDGHFAFSSLTRSYGMFKNVRSLILMKGLKYDVHLKEKVGYYGEDLILALTDCQLGSCWVAGTFDKTKISISDHEELVCVITLGKVPPITTKEKVLRSSMHRKKKTIQERLSTDQDIPEWIEKGMEAVLLAPSAVNRQKPTFQYKNNQLTAHVMDDYFTDMIDLGIAKKHFELVTGGKFELGNGGLFQII